MMHDRNGKARTAMFKRFLRDEGGATAIEYGIILACLSMVIIAGIQTFGNSMQARFTETAKFLDDTHIPSQTTPDE